MAIKISAKKKQVKPDSKPDGNEPNDVELEIDEARLSSSLASFVQSRAGGDAQRANLLLYQDNHNWREKNRKLTEDNRVLQEQVSQMPEGGTILTADETKVWEAFQALLAARKYSKVEEITAALSSLDNLTIKNQTLERGSLLTKAAAAHDYQVDVFSRLANDDKLEFTSRKEKDEQGVERDVYFVKVPDATDQSKFTERKLPEYVDEKWKPYLPALKQADAHGNPGNSGVYVPAQGGPTPPRKQASPTGSYLTSRYGTPAKQ